MKKLIIIFFGLFCYIGFSISQNIKINEIMASNNSVIQDEANEFDDWIELYNAENESVNISGLFLSDDQDNPAKWFVESTEPDKTTISAGGYLILWADNDTDQGILHMNFKLGKNGEFISIYKLVSNQYILVDSLSFGEQKEDISFGRENDGSDNLVYFSEPTPGSANSGNIINILQTPELSNKSGFYADPFFLEITSSDDNVDIYYTLDGSDPDEDSYQYNNPIEIGSLLGKPNGISTIRTTSDQGFNFWEEPDGEVFKITALKTRTIGSNGAISKVVSRSFFVDPMIHSRYKIPIVSIITDSLNFFDADSGIYIAGNGYNGTDYLSANFSQRGNDWERSIYLEIFEPDGNEILSQNAGIRISGNASRSTCIKSLRLYARKEYGENRFNYNFFPDERIDNFKRLILRNSGNDAWQTYFRDAFTHNLGFEMGIDRMAYKPMVVFLNGEFWGIHNMRERLDKYFIENHYNIKEDEIDLLNRNSEIVEGDLIHYNLMRDYLQNNDLTQSENLAVLDTLMDIDNFSHYLTLLMYIGNTDWPQNNVKYWRKKTEKYLPENGPGKDGRWRWMVHDTDYGFGRINDYSFNTFNYVLHDQSGWSTLIIHSLLGGSDYPGNSEFRKNFFSYFSDCLNTTLSSEKLLRDFEYFKSGIANEMNEHCERWINIKSVDVWDNWIDVLREFAVNRPKYIREFMIDEFDEISDSIKIEITVNDFDSGIIKINSIELSEHTYGIENPVYPWTGIYFSNIPIKLKAIPAMGYEFKKWEGIDVDDISEVEVILTEDTEIYAVFEPVTEWNALVINELYYNPASEHGGELVAEFLELFSPGTEELNIGGYYFKEGIQFTFPSGTTIGSGEYIILAKNPDTYEGNSNQVFGYQGSLSNAGEQVVLVDAGGEIIDELVYSDRDFWPEAADGSGYSLELDDPFKDNMQYQNWRTSYIPGGTPGRENSQPQSFEGLVINEVLSFPDGIISDEFGDYDDWIEIYNSGNESFNISGLHFSDNGNLDNGTVIPINYPDSMIIESGEFMILWADKDPEQGVFHLDIKLSALGEKLLLYNSYNKTYKLIDSLSFPALDMDLTFGRFPDGSANILELNIPSPENRNVSAMKNLFDSIYINEFMARNTTTYEDEYGNYEDWIEIYNDGNSSIDIGGIYISDDLTQSQSFKIPVGTPEKTTIGPKSFLIFSADGKPELGITHLNFNLTGAGEQIGLSYYNNTILSFIDSLSYENQTADISFGRVVDGWPAWQYFNMPTPGESNNSEEVKISGLVINEFMARNGDTYVDEYSNFVDWIEIYNDSDTIIDLGGLYFTDNFNELNKSQVPISFPEITKVAPGEFIVFWVDKNPEFGPLHLNFELKGNGEEIALSQQYHGILTIIDSITYPQQSTNISYGRIPDAGDSWHYFNSPTPGLSNDISDINDIGNAYKEEINVFPNPFSEEININFYLEKYSKLRINIYDVSGNLINTISNKIFLPGLNSVIWNGKGIDGTTIAPGVYYVKLFLNNRTVTEKIMLLK